MVKELQQSIESITNQINDLVWYQVSLTTNKQVCVFNHYLDKNLIKDELSSNPLLSCVYKILSIRVPYVSISNKEDSSSGNSSAIEVSFWHKIDPEEISFEAALNIIENLELLFSNYQDELASQKIKLPNTTKMYDDLVKHINKKKKGQITIYGISIDFFDKFYVDDTLDMLIMLFKYVRQYCGSDMRLIDKKDLPHVYNAAILLNSTIKNYMTLLNVF